VRTCDLGHNLSLWRARASKDDGNNIRAKINEEIFNLDHKIQDELTRRELESSKTIRLLEDKIHLLTQTSERHSEATTVSIRKISQSLDTERDERCQFEDSMMRLIEGQLSKVHQGIERHPNIQSEN